MVPAGFGELAAVDAYAIAINLAYLNLPNLRFADRIKTKIRHLVELCDTQKRAAAHRDDAAYRPVYEVGKLDELRDVLPPATNSNSTGNLRTQTFMFIWCTPVVYKNSTIPLDKIVAATFLTISSIYMYVIIMARLGSQPDDAIALFKMMIVFVFIPAAFLTLFFALKQDGFGASLTAFVCLYSLYCFYLPHWPLTFDVNNPHAVLLLLAFFVGVTTLFVLASFALYPQAEKHYVEETRRIFDIQSPLPVDSKKGQ